MGHLAEKSFEGVIAGCKRCRARAFEVTSYIDRQVSVMLAEPNEDGRWTHDGEKFIDGTYRIRCIACSDEPYASDDCPRCHRPGGLSEALRSTARLAVPKRCPSCKGTELTLLAFAPARVRTGEGRPTAPTPISQYGDPGFHVVGILCDCCEWVAAPEGCPLCGGPGPLRERP